MSGRLLMPAGALMASLVLLGVAGCSSGTAGNRFERSGTVRYEGQPVPFGRIFFNPDVAKGNSGPQGSGEIRNGRYRTNPGQGSIAGPVVVRMIGFDGKQPPGPDGDMLPNGQQLFPPYEVAVELPGQSSTQDFEVPAGGGR